MAANLPVVPAHDLMSWLPTRGLSHSSSVLVTAAGLIVNEGGFYFYFLPDLSSSVVKDSQGISIYIFTASFSQLLISHSTCDPFIK